MVKTPLDGLDDYRPAQPPDTVGECALCHKPLKLRYHWLFSRWLHNTVHDKCAEAYDRNTSATYAKPSDQEIPARFAHFDGAKVNAEAVATASTFTPESELRALAIVGLPGRAKSRLAWAVVRTFFDQLETATGQKYWVDYFLFSDLAFEPDRNLLIKAKTTRFCFLDDIGCTQSYGRERAQLQNIIRYRLETRRWSIFTIDSLDFDPSLPDLLRDRAVTVLIDT